MKLMRFPWFLALVMIGVAPTACVRCNLWGKSAAIHPADYDHPVRVACVGDSITFGATLKERANNSYPAQLGAMLGPQWDARNFGVSGATLLKQGNRPYWTQKAFKSAQDFQPDAVVIMLGTNDTKPRNWEKHGADFSADYQALIDAFATLPSHPRIWILKPVPSFPGNWDITDKVLVEQINPKIEQVARQAGVGLIDLHAALAEHGDLFPDKVHPDARGARLIAETVYRTLTGRRAPTAKKAGQPASK